MSSKHIVILQGSPRKNGNSAILAEQVQEGIQSVGGTVESVYLHGLNIRPCQGCDGCQQTNDSQCVIKDDMQQLYPKLCDADGIVLASPIYWFSITAQMKLCIDRWYALHRHTGNKLAGKPMGIVLTYGDKDPYTSGAINAIRSYQDMFRYIGSEIKGIVYGSALEAGAIEKQTDVLDGAYKLGQHMGKER